MLHKSAILTFCALSIIFSIGQCQNELFELNVIHHNDFHARFEETTTSSTTCHDPTIEGGTTCIGGLSRLYTAVTQMLAAKPESLLLDAGDVFQGTMWYTILKWNVTQYFLDMLPHDAHTLGNHEFDDGIEGVVPYLERIRAPVVVSNIDDTNEPTFQGKYNKSVVLQRNGRQIGIIGVLLATTNSLSQTRNLIFLDEAQSVKEEAKRLTALGINIIIVLSHCGLDIDRIIAQKAGPYIDLIVGGHSHTLLFTGDTPSGETPVDVYPVIEINEDSQKQVPIVQASAYTKYLGEITLYFDGFGVLQYWEGQPLYLANSIPQDPDMMKLLAPFKDEVDMIGKQETGSTRVLLSRDRCGNDECNLGSFMCDAFVDSMVEKAQVGQWTYSGICINNQGGIRSSINRGNISLEDLVLAMPFGNTVDTFDLKGVNLLEAIEYSLSTSWSDDSFFGGNMLQVSGLRGIYNVSKPIGQRVERLLVRCIDCSVPIYESLDLEKEYKITSQSFLRGGGDGFTMISNNLKNLEVGDTDINVLQDYVLKQSPIMQWLDNRIILHEN